MAVPPYKQIDVDIVHEAFVVCVKDAWKHLLENAKKIAQTVGMKPEDVVLGRAPSHHAPYQLMFYFPTSHARWDAPRLLYQRLPTSTVWDEPKLKGGRFPVRYQRGDPSANARI